MKKTFLTFATLAAVSLGLGVAVGAETTPASSAAGKSSVSATDKMFIKKAAKGGMMEVAMGKLASQSATDAEVKKFGARMVEDHGKANDELKALAGKRGVKVPKEKEMPKWKSDKDYVDAMVKDHEKDLAEFQKEAKDGTDADLKAFADKTSKVIDEHLKMIKEIQGKMK